MTMIAESTDSLWDGWSPPVELTRSMPRPVQLKGQGVVLLIMAFVFAAAGIGGGIAFRIQGVHEEATARQMKADGQETDGVVERLWRTGGKSPRDMVAYQFSVRGDLYHHEADISRSHWDALYSGSPIAIRYLPSNPKISFPAADPPTPMPLFVAFVFGGSFLLSSGLMYNMVRSARRLLEDGRAAPGVVTGNRMMGGRNRRNQIVYQFKLQDGSAYRGRASRGSIPEGTRICVVYNPDNPRRNAPFPFGLVKVADQ